MRDLNVSTKTNKSLLFIRADATTKIGTGHIMRCIALAQAYQDKGGRVIFLSYCESDYLHTRILNEGCEYFPLENIHSRSSDLELTFDFMSKFRDPQSSIPNWVVLDGYHFDSAYQKAIKKAGFRLFCIDDYGQADHYYADMILNQNISADASFYQSRELHTQLLLGTNYVLLRREFWPWRGWKRIIPAIASKILVTMGGADSNNVTLKVIEAIKLLNKPTLDVKIVVGPSNPNAEAIKNSMLYAPCQMQYVENTINMPELMGWADLAISAGGSTCWELAFMALPSIIVMTADNQRYNAKVLDRENISTNLGWHQDVSAEKIASQLKHLMNNSEMRSLMSQHGQVLVDGYGGQRISEIIIGQLLKLRPMLSDDCEMVWRWRNDYSVRAVSFSEAFITWEEHLSWFHERICRPYFYLALNQDDLPVGQVRFDQKQSEIIISIMIDSKFRHKNYGTCLVTIACEKMFFDSDMTDIHAYLRPDNEASRQTFVKAGFKELPETVYQGHPAYHFILTKYDSYPK